jgi:hypothetical protein
MFIYVDYVYLILLFLTSNDMVKKKNITSETLYPNVDVTNMTNIDARDDPLHEELDVRTTGNNDDTL